MGRHLVFLSSCCTIATVSISRVIKLTVVVTSNTSSLVTMASKKTPPIGAINVPFLISTATPSAAASKKRQDLKDKMKSMARRSRNSSCSEKPRSIVGRRRDLDVSELDQSTSTMGSGLGDDEPEDIGASFMRNLEGTLLEQDDSSSESSYWSSSDEDSSSEEESDDDMDSGPEISDSDVGLTTETDDSAPKNNRRRAKRNDSTLSLDALLKVQMQLGDAKKPPPKDKEIRRRGRRIGKEYTATSLGALARKVGSSTGNEDMKSAVQGFRRTESSGNIPTKTTPKKFLHVQQAAPSVRVEKVPVLRGMLDQSTRSSTRSSAVKVDRRAPSKPVVEAPVVKPKDHYLNILKESGITAPLVKFDTLVDFFKPNTAEDKAAFDMALVGAVRDQNLEKLHTLYSAGHPMQARSTFGESLVHICARRGTPEMLRFLLSLKGDGDGIGGVSCQVCCDYGRTPLHDAAWSTHAVSLEMMKILINECPDLLLVLDKRGFMPLDYIPRTRWAQCCAWLDKHKDMLMPTGVLFGDSSDSESSDEEYDSDDDDSDYETD